MIKNIAQRYHLYVVQVILTLFILLLNSHHWLIPSVIPALLLVFSQQLLKKQQYLESPDYQGKLPNSLFLSKYRIFLAAISIMGAMLIMPGLLPSMIEVSLPYVYCGFSLLFFSLLFILYFQESTRACFFCDLGLIAFLLAFFCESIVRFICHG